MEIKTETKNTLLKRTEILGSIESDTNPGFEKAKQEISEKTKADPENVVIKSVKNNFGSNEYLIEAFVYESKEQKDKIEPKVKPKKGATA